MMREPTSIIPVSELWYSRDEDAWNDALARYWTLVQPGNLELERAMERLDRGRLLRLSPDGWFDFLHDEYFRWKYTAPNRYATTTAVLHRKSSASDGRAALHAVKHRLLTLDPSNVRTAINIANKIPGLGTAGASGLLALLYPRSIGTVDQFVVKALREVPDLPEARELARMNQERLTARDAHVLVQIMRRQATILAATFKVPWTPRAIDKVLWTYGR
ncbi:MAG: hypothetical protein M3O61_08075 [Gemmatimonadota bacterium]|nr:hypothetical protein [Gemmatimonadota bacterium]